MKGMFITTVGKVCAICFLVAGFVSWAGVVCADDITAKLSTGDGSDAFQVQDSGSTTLMHIQSDGKVGIGTTNPGAKLEIDPGNVSIVPLEITQGFSHSNLVNFKKNSDSSDIFSITLQGSGDIPTFYDGNTGSLQSSIAMKGGNVGIGYINQDFGGKLLVNGNVGIGTNIPQSTLQVSGNYIQFPTITGDAPPPADCLNAAQAGRIVVRTDGSTNIYICTGAGWVGK